MSAATDRLGDGNPVAGVGDCPLPLDRTPGMSQEDRPPASRVIPASTSLIMSPRSSQRRPRGRAQAQEVPHESAFPGPACGRHARRQRRRARGDRKPGPGMLIRAAERARARPRSSWMIGDMISDVLAGINAGCRGRSSLTIRAVRKRGRGIPRRRPEGRRRPVVGRRHRPGGRTCVRSRSAASRLDRHAARSATHGART